MAQTILSEKKSTVGDPYAFFTVQVTPSDRTSTSVKLAITVKSHLQWSDSLLGNGYTMTGYLKVNGTSYYITLKTSSEVWSGTTVYTATRTITVSDLSESETSLSGITFRVAGESRLDETSCSSITIPSGNGASTFTLSATSVNIGSSLTVTISRVVSTNYHKIVASFNGSSHTFTSNAGTSATLTFSSSNFSSWFSSTSPEITVALIMTTYDSSGTKLGATVSRITFKNPALYDVRHGGTYQFNDSLWKRVKQRLRNSTWKKTVPYVFNGTEWKKI